MKKMMILAMMMVMTITASAMSYSNARREALFLSDKMAYELNLTDAQYAAVYEINLDYLLSVDSRDVFGVWWNRRNADLRYVLSGWQYDKYVRMSYFYRPLAWRNGAWFFGVYDRYNRSLFYNSRPAVYVSYKGGNNRLSANLYAGRGFHNNGMATRNMGKTNHFDRTSHAGKGNAVGKGKGNNGHFGTRNH